jgi:hypothetical protein
MSDYLDIAQTSWDEIPEVQTLPNGTYRLKARSASFKEPKEEGKNGSVLIVYTPTMAMDDVDEDQLAELAKDGNEYDLANNTIFHRIWIERPTDWKTVQKHIAKHGVDLKNKSLQEGLEALKGSEVLAYLSSRTFTDGAGETKEENVASQFAVEE